MKMEDIYVDASCMCKNKWYYYTSLWQYLINVPFANPKYHTVLIIYHKLKNYATTQ